MPVRRLFERLRIAVALAGLVLAAPASAGDVEPASWVYDRPLAQIKAELAEILGCSWVAEDYRPGFIVCSADGAKFDLRLLAVDGKLETVSILMPHVNDPVGDDYFIRESTVATARKVFAYFFPKWTDYEPGWEQHGVAWLDEALKHAHVSRQPKGMRMQAGKQHYVSVIVQAAGFSYNNHPLGDSFVSMAFTPTAENYIWYPPFMDGGDEMWHGYRPWPTCNSGMWRSLKCDPR